MQFRLTPLAGRPAAVWAIGWFALATLVTLSLWRPAFHLLPFTFYFAAMAIIAARTGAWYGLGSIVGAIAVIAPLIDAPPGTVCLRLSAIEAGRPHGLSYGSSVISNELHVGTHGNKSISTLQSIMRSTK